MKHSRFHLDNKYSGKGYSLFPFPFPIPIPFPNPSPSCLTISHTDIRIYKILTPWASVEAKNVKLQAKDQPLCTFRGRCIKRAIVGRCRSQLFRRQLCLCAAKHKTKLTYQTIPNTHHMELRLCIIHIKYDQTSAFLTRNL